MTSGSFVGAGIVEDGVAVLADQHDTHARRRLREIAAQLEDMT
jgi:hypothetical protein